MHPDFPEPPPFVNLPDRELITQEPPQVGDQPLPGHNDREYIDFADQGGGYVPESYEWQSNPKQEHDEESSH